MKKGKRIPLWTANLVDKKTKKSEWVNIIAPEQVKSNNGRYLVFADRNIKEFLSTNKNIFGGCMFLGYVERVNKNTLELPIIKDEEEEKENDWE